MGDDWCLPISAASRIGFNSREHGQVLDALGVHEAGLTGP